MKDEKNSINVNVLSARSKKDIENSVNSALSSSTEGKMEFYSLHIHYLNKSIEKYAITRLEKIFSEADYFIIDWTNIDFIDDNRMWFLRLILLKKVYYVLFVKDTILDNLIADVDSKNIISCKSNVNIFETDQYMSIILKNIEEIINKRLYCDELFYKLWFPEDTFDITLVVAVDDERPIDASLTSHNYGFVDSIADKDAVLEISKLLSRRYPKARITVCKTDNFNPQDIRKNLVIIGGPGGDGYVRADGTKIESGGNEICRKLSHNIQSKISYSDNCEEMIVFNQRYSAKYDKTAIMSEDIGYFSALQNPSNLKNRIVLIHGIHTLGVLGAARVFSDERDAEKNYETIYKWMVNRESDSGINFETFFKVDVLNGESFCPILNSDKIFCFNDKSSSSKENSKSILSLDEKGNIDCRAIKDQLSLLIEDINRELPLLKRDAPNAYREFKEDLKILYELQGNRDAKYINSIFSDIYLRWKENIR